MSSSYFRAFTLVFLLTLPLVNPWVRGDGVGFYAYIHALLIHHDLNFESEWLAGNESFTMDRVDPDGKLNSLQYTSTGHIDNHWTVGPAMLWAPFLVPVHWAVVTLQRHGANVRPDGFSKPYMETMALATALYGFLGLCLSFSLARQYVDERWAFLATAGIWFASSLPVYIYFNPSWSHAHSVFAVALFLWYWQRTRAERTLTQWVILGLISGLLLNIHYPNIAVLLIPLLESLAVYWRVAQASRPWKLMAKPAPALQTGDGPGMATPRAARHDWTVARRLLAANLLYSLATVVAFLPTLVTRKIIYGHALHFGYEGLLRWTAPWLPNVLLSSDHGLLTWTPIVIPALAGLWLLRRRDRELAIYLSVAFLAFYYLIACTSFWDGLSSFGNRYFVCWTPLFVLGLAVSLSEFVCWLKNTRAAEVVAVGTITLFIVWNLAFIFQWGTHLVPARGPISWSAMVKNQFEVVPKNVFVQVKSYVTNRSALMQHLEQEDVVKLRNKRMTLTERKR